MDYRHCRDTRKREIRWALLCHRIGKNAELWEIMGNCCASSGAVDSFPSMKNSQPNSVSDRLTRMSARDVAALSRLLDRLCASGRLDVDAVETMLAARAGDRPTDSVSRASGARS